jgi:UV DNA damage repair endonuclease
VRVAAWGDFDRETWQSTGIGYSVEVSSPASSDAIDELLRIVDDVAEIPKALRSATTVERI